MDVDMWVWRNPVFYRQWRSSQCRSPQSISAGPCRETQMRCPHWTILCYLSCNWGIHTMMADMREHLQKVHILPEQQWKVRKEVLVCQHQLLICSSSLVLCSERSWISLSQVSDAIDLSCQLKHMACLWTVTGRHLSLGFIIWSWISPWDLLLGPHFYHFVPHRDYTTRFWRASGVGVTTRHCILQEYWKYAAKELGCETCRFRAPWVHALEYNQALKQLSIHRAWANVHRQGIG